MREAQIIVEAALLRDARLAWLAAQYNRFAVHQPNDLPDQPELARPKGVSREADLVEARAWMRSVSRRSPNGS